MGKDGMDGCEEHTVLYIIGALIAGILLGAGGVFYEIIKKLGR